MLAQITGQLGAMVGKSVQERLFGNPTEHEICQSAQMGLAEALVLQDLACCLLTPGTMVGQRCPEETDLIF